MMLEIARLWGREPDWLYRLPVEERVRLIAWYQVAREQGQGRR